MAKRTWGNPKLKYCPTRNKVWQLQYDATNLTYKLIVYRDMPSYGLVRQEAPTKYKEYIR